MEGKSKSSARDSSARDHEPDPSAHVSPAAPEAAAQEEVDGPALDESMLEVERRVVRWWHPVLALLALLAIYWLARAFGLVSMLQDMRSWVESVGTEGPLLFVLAYVVLTMLGIPGSWLTLAAGALFGSVVGLIAVIVASNTSAVLSFLIARHWLRGRVDKWTNRSPRFQKLNRLTERHGPAVVVIVRLLNLFPFAMVNYGFGLTRVRFRTYAIWSFIGKIPGTALMVVGVDAIIEALVDRQVPWDLVVIVVVMAGLIMLALRLLHQRIQANSQR